MTGASIWAAKSHLIEVRSCPVWIHVWALVVASLGVRIDQLQLLATDSLTIGRSTCAGCLHRVCSVPDLVYSIIAGVIAYIA